MSKQIKITSEGAQFDAYVALPETGNDPVIVLL